MKKKSFRKEILRKLFHLMELPLLAGYTVIRHLFSERLAILGVTVVLLILLEIEHMRLEYNFPKFPKAFDLFRAKERNNVTGMLFFICATIIVFSAFDYPIAVTALLLTVFGDLVSALAGIKYGKHILHKEKTLEGFLAGLTINCFVGYLLLPAYPLIFLSMALVASVVEVLTGKLDDNLTVPLVSAFVGQMLAYIWQSPLDIFPGPLMGQFLKVFFP